MKKSLYFLLSTTLLLNASLASAVDTVTFTGYPTPPNGGNIFYDSMVGPSGAALQQQQAAMAARVAYEKQKACAQVKANIEAAEATCDLGAANTKFDYINSCPTAISISAGGIGGSVIGLEWAPRQVCTEKAQAQYDVDIARCNATAAVRMANLAKECG